MLPIRDVIPSRTTPWVVLAGLAAYVASAALSLIAHPGWLAVLASVVAAGVLGETLEDRLGHARMAGFLAVGSAMAVGAWHGLGAPGPLSIAAVTGGVASLLGGYFALFFRSRVLVFVGIDVVEVPALMLLATWAALHAVSLDPAEAAWLGRGLLAAQLTGLATGAAAVWIFKRRERFAPAWWS